MSTPLTAEIDELRRQLAEERRLRAEWMAQQEPVAWRVKDFADEWILCGTEKGAMIYKKNFGNLVQPLYAAPVAAQQAAATAAYKWGYEYLQSRMESIGRHGWAHDCDGEIEDRIKTAPVAKPAAQDCVSVPRELIDRFPEINPSNYDHDDACALNAWGVEVVLAASKEPKT